MAHNARHSSESAEWYTPREYVEAARSVMGGIDLDPASDREANKTVKAANFYTAGDDGLSQSWAGRLLLNPPGGKNASGGLVAQFWRKLIESEDVSEVVWIGYSLEQLQVLQVGNRVSPVDFSMCIPRKRIAFGSSPALMQQRAEAGKTSTARSPTHANYITYCGPNQQRFADVFGRFGRVRLIGGADVREPVAEPVHEATAARVGLPYAVGSGTSREAASSMNINAATIRAAILAEIMRRGDRGLTCDEAEVLFGRSHQTTSARFWELKRDNKVRKNGTRPTRSGRRADIMVAVVPAAIGSWMGDKRAAFEAGQVE